MTRIRAAERSDFTALHDLFAAQNAHHATLVPDLVRRAECALERAELAKILDDPARGLRVIELESTVVGASLIEEREEGDDRFRRSRRFVHVRELVIDGRYRRRGLGRQLMDDVASWARARGIKEIELNVFERNEPAIAFYESLGFRTLRRHMRTKT